MMEEEDEQEEIEITTKLSATESKLKSQFRITKRGNKLLHSIKENYIRHDIGFGYYLNKQKEQMHLGSKEEFINYLADFDLVICTVSMLLFDLDILENTNFSSRAKILISQGSLSILMQEHKQSHYNRVMELFYSHENFLFLPDVYHADILKMINKEVSTEEAIAEFISQQVLGIPNKIVVIKATVPTSNKSPEKKGFIIKSLQEYLVDLQQSADDNPNNNNIIPSSLLNNVAQLEIVKTPDQITFEKQYIPTPLVTHLSANEIQKGLSNNKLYKGTFRVSQKSKSINDIWNFTHAHVVIHENNERVLVKIQGIQDINCATDGDIVAIKMNPVDQWIAENLQDKPSLEGEERKIVEISRETLEPSIEEQENLPITNNSQNQQKKPTARVIGIIRRNLRSNYCGSFLPTNSKQGERSTLSNLYNVKNTRLIFPVDTRIPPILIHLANNPKEYLNKRLLVTIDVWPQSSLFPIGHYVSTMGQKGNKDVETAVILHEFNIPTSQFSQSVLACLPPADFEVLPTEDRRDLRSLPILSIDPPGCQDIDDALHCLQLENGNYQVGVHIADVTHFLKAGSAMDMEASQRSTSTYLVNKRLDMLPSRLTTDLCSLKPHVDRYAFSVLWEITEEAKIVNVEFCKSIIHSIAGLTYQQAQELIDNDTTNNDSVKAKAVRGLNLLATKLKQRRIQSGALTLASPAVKFTLDDSINPTDVQSYEIFQTNALVEEFMLLANVTVAKKTLRHYPTLSVLRRHPSPNREAFATLISKVKSQLTLQLNIDTSKELADSLDYLATQVSDKYLNTLVRILSTRCMSPAQYFHSGQYISNPQEWHHYGLAAPVYTHFTSPIRRYADVCVHRLLAAAIGVEALPSKLTKKDYLFQLCRHLNVKHRNAQLAGRASVYLHTLLFFKHLVFTNQVQETEGVDAYVLDVDLNSLVVSVMVPKYGIEGKIYLEQYKGSSSDSDQVHRILENQIWAKDEALQQIKWTIVKTNGLKEKCSIQVFDKIKVSINLIDGSTGEIVTKNRGKGNDNEEDCDSGQYELLLKLVQPSLMHWQDEKGETTKKRESKGGNKRKKRRVKK